MKYCKTTTLTHRISFDYPSCIEDINLLLINEGLIANSNLFTDGEFVLNLDCVEDAISKKLCRGNNKSMDFSFGISNLEKNVQLMVLVEAKFNNLNPNNIRRDSLKEKVEGSILALTNAIPIYANYIFLFNTDKKEEAKNRFFRMNPKVPNEFLVMDINELVSTFF